jgi:hypothetical protein
MGKHNNSREHLEKFIDTHQKYLDKTAERREFVSFVYDDVMNDILLNLESDKHNKLLLLEDLLDREAQRLIGIMENERKSIEGAQDKIKELV